MEMKYIPCDDDMDGPIPEGKCGAIGSGWVDLTAIEHCGNEAAGMWCGLPLCLRHLKQKRNRDWRITQQGISLR